jgi:hypothetical protein
VRIFAFDEGLRFAEKGNRLAFFGLALTIFINLTCSRSAFGVTVAGEFSNGYNDCGLYLTGVNGMQHYGK